MTEPTINIPPAEFQARADRLLEHIQAQQLSGVVLFDNAYILYFTGFAFIPTERPIAFVMNARGDKAMFVPRLEVEHAQGQTGFAMLTEFMNEWYDEHVRWTDNVMKVAAAQSPENRALLAKWVAHYQPLVSAALEPVAQRAFGERTAAALDAGATQLAARLAKSGVC